MKFSVLTAGFVLLTASAQAETTWQMHINFPAGNFDTQNAMKFAEAVKTQTNGEVVIEVMPGGSLGLKGPEVLGAVRDGIVPIAHYHLDTAVGEEPFFGIQGVPYLTRNFADAAKLEAMAAPTYEMIAERNNQKILYSVFWPGVQLYTRNPVVDVADLDALKIRTGNKPSTDFFADMGAAPTLMPWADALVALASGGLDGIATSATSGVDGKFWEFMGAVNTISYVNPTAVVAVNLDAFNALSPENQQIITELAAKMQPEFRAVSESEDSVRLEELAAAGMVVSAPSEAFSTALEEAAKKQWDAFASTGGPEAAKVMDAYLAERDR
ncbi:TRAP transporter substrate-binding protein [uncultured Paracoccus sp.]|uniref:TRAP transporter substrate-binding protein n=1 Tax=uncultured Paracoccus sp. TaxID=189685 RepID=UPI002628B475|nr:TRAP transporter substrate-binding protein [uncultured Paracoccus sp.]